MDAGGLAVVAIAGDPDGTGVDIGRDVGVGEADADGFGGWECCGAVGGGEAEEEPDGGEREGSEPVHGAISWCHARVAIGIIPAKEETESKGAGGARRGVEGVAGGMASGRLVELQGAVGVDFVGVREAVEVLW
jgi:hypothetical protein